MVSLSQRKPEQNSQPKFAAAGEGEDSSGDFQKFAVTEVSEVMLQVSYNLGMSIFSILGCSFRAPIYWTLL